MCGVVCLPQPCVLVWLWAQAVAVCRTSLLTRYLVHIQQLLWIFPAISISNSSFGIVSIIKRRWPIMFYKYLLVIYNTHHCVSINEITWVIYIQLITLNRAASEWCTEYCWKWMNISRGLRPLKDSLLWCICVRACVFIILPLHRQRLC